MRVFIFITFVVQFTSASRIYGYFIDRNGSNVTMTTNLDDNQLCYHYLKGIRINGRDPNQPYTYGFWVEDERPPIVVVKAPDSKWALATKEEFSEATKHQTHSPVYNQDFNYCTSVFESLKDEKARDVFCRSRSPMALKHRDICVTRNASWFWQLGLSACARSVGLLRGSV